MARGRCDRIGDVTQQAGEGEIERIRRGGFGAIPMAAFDLRARKGD
jgi:hypothetical protein